jgi:hypothetical protein
VFTKYEQFKRNIKMHLEDHPNENLDGNAADVLKRRFEEDYQRHLGDGARFVQLESASKVKCPGNALMLFRKKCTSPTGAAKSLLRRRLWH